MLVPILSSNKTNQLQTPNNTLFIGCTILFSASYPIVLRFVLCGKKFYCTANALSSIYAIKKSNLSLHRTAVCVVVFNMNTNTNTNSNTNYVNT